MGWDPFRKTLPSIFEKNGDKVYRIRRIREHLVELERSEQLCLVIRDRKHPDLRQVRPSGRRKLYGYAMSAPG